MKTVLNRTRLRTLTLGVGASAMAMACSFGSVSDDDLSSGSFEPIENDVTDMPGEVNTPVTGGEVNTPVTGGGLEDPVPDPPATAGEPADVMTSDMTDFGVDGQYTTELATQAMGVLELNCAGCHSNGVALGGLGNILDFSAMVDSGTIVRGSSVDSKLFNRMEVGTMPPAASTQRPDVGQINAVGQFIDGLVDPNGDCEPLAPITYDELYTSMLQDVLAQDLDDREFVRYLGSTYASNAGLCDRDLKRQEYALFKMINSVSLKTTITQPVPVNDSRTLFRIDIRDYDWNRDIDLEDDGIVDFEDAWLAILDAVGPYAVEFEGDEADELKLQTEVAVPFLPINAFVQEITGGDLYYALIDGRQNLNDTQVDLGVDVQNSIDDQTFWRAGFSTSGVSKQERAVTRQEIGDYRGNFWLSQDFADNVGNDSLYSDPLDFEFNGGEAIYSLPNGLQAYYATDDNGNRVSEVPVNIVIDPAQNNGVVTNAASCHSCHNGGMIPFTDKVREFVLENAIGLQLDAQTIEDVEDQYIPVARFNRVVEEDSERHLNAVEKAGVPRGTADSISRVFLQFQLGDVTADLAAGELGIPVELMLKNLNLLDPVLAPLRDGLGSLSRNDFTEVFFDSICRMQSFSQNRPTNCVL